MSVVYTNSALNASKPMTVSIQIDASGNDRKVILAIPVEDTNPFGITATFDPSGVNVAMTEVADGLLSDTANKLHCRFFYIDESSLPASAGTYTISCTWQGTNNRTLLSVIACNDMATGEPRDVNTNEASSASSITTTITSLSTDTVFDGCGTLDPYAEQTVGTGQTSIVVDTSGPSSSYSTGNTSHSWTDPNTGSWAWFLSVAAWKAVAASGTTVTLVSDSITITDGTLGINAEKSISLVADTISITDGTLAVGVSHNIDLITDALSITDGLLSVQANVDTNIDLISEALSITDGTLPISAFINTNVDLIGDSLIITDGILTITALSDTNITLVPDSIAITDGTLPISALVDTNINLISDTIAITDGTLPITLGTVFQIDLIADTISIVDGTLSISADKNISLIEDTITISDGTLSITSGAKVVRSGGGTVIDSWEPGKMSKAMRARILKDDARLLDYIMNNIDNIEGECNDNQF